MNSKITYRKQFTRCGKERCRKCREGEGHGPYWYAYWSEKGRTVSKYIGAHLPSDVEETQQVPAQHMPPSSPSLQDEERAPLSGSASLISPTLISPTLKVYMLGQLRLEHRSGSEWRLVDNRIWHRRRVRALLSCLLSCPGRRLGREQVMEMLWPDLDIDIAANRLNGAVHELRQILEPEIARPAASSMLRLERDILELADSSQMWVDAEVFEQRLKEANSSSDPVQIERLLEEADELYGGDYLLEEMYSEWATPRRDALQRSWVGLLLNLANLRVERGAFANAIQTLERLHTADPANETALQRMMLLLTQLDRRGEALHLYRKHVMLMERDYESEPLPETRALYETLRQGYRPEPLPVKAPVLLKEPEPVIESPIEKMAVVPVAVSEISFVRPSLHLSRHNQSPLVGRKRELDTIRQLMLSIEGMFDRSSPAVRGQRNGQVREVLRMPVALTPKHPHLLLLVGEPGIGKTRLAEELSLEAYARGWTVAWSRAYEQEGTIPYRPWTEVLRTLLQGVLTQLESSHLAGGSPHPLQLHLERLSALLPEVAIHALTPHLRSSPPLSYEQERLYLWEAALGLLEAVSQHHPLLLVLDDVHWIDDSSIELLTYLTHHLQNQPILLAGTCRDGELPPVHKLRTLIADLRREQAIVALSVQPLTESQIGTLVAHLPENLVQSVQTRASGNPFFAEELARYVVAIDDGEVPVLPMAPGEIAPRAYSTRTASRHRSSHEGTRSPRLLPEAIAAVLERRLNRLSSECQALLGKAAVLGGSFELGQLLPMTTEQDEDIVLDLLEEATYAGLLTEEGTGAHIVYHFWHPLIVSHLYERLSAARRAQLHRKAAEAIRVSHSAAQQEKVAAAIVNHLSRGGGDPQHIAHYAELAGNRAYALAAYAEVQHYYLLVIQALVGATLPSFGTTDSRAQIRHITPALIATLSLPAQGAHDLLHICQMLERIAECSMVQGNFEDGRHLYSCILATRTSDAFRQQLSAAGDEREVQQREAQAQALLWRELGNTWVETSEYDRAYECFGRGQAVLTQVGIAEGTAWACLQLQYGEMHRLVGNFHEARRYFRDALAMLEQRTLNAEEMVAPPFTAFVRRNLSYTGKDIQTRTERTLIGDPMEIGYAHERLGIVAASLGQISEALTHMHTALAIYEQNELVMEMTRVCGNLGATYITRGELVSASTYLHRARDLAERAGALPNLTFVTGNLADVAQRSGDLQESEVWFKRSVALSEQLHDRHRISWFNAELARVQQDLGYVHEASVSIHRALTLARELRNPRHLQFALICLGDLRLTEAIIAYYLQPPGSLANGNQPAPSYRRLLLRAKATLQRAMRLKGLEIEPMIEGKLLLAMVYSLLDEQETAKEMALQTLVEAQEQETTRVIGRVQRLLGRIMASQGRYAESDYYFKQSMQLSFSCGLRLDFARTLHNYGLAMIMHAEDATREPQNVIQLRGQHRARESYEQGLLYLEEAREIFAASHAAYDLTLVELTLAHCKQQASSKVQP